MQTIATNNNSQSMHFAYPLLNYVSASMFGKRKQKKFLFLIIPMNFSIGSNNSSTSMTSNTPRHYLACSYFVSQYQTIRSFAEDLSVKFGKSLEEIRLWMKYNEVNKF
jgi:hypothetical protein